MKDEICWEPWIKTKPNLISLFGTDNPAGASPSDNLHSAERLLWKFLKIHFSQVSSWMKVKQQYCLNSRSTFAAPMVHFYYCRAQDAATIAITVAKVSLCQIVRKFSKLSSLNSHPKLKVRNDYDFLAHEKLQGSRLSLKGNSQFDLIKIWSLRFIALSHM